MGTVAARVPDQDVIRAAIGMAVRAPSIHNSQPWRFRVGAGTVHLLADHTRRLGATDPDGKDLLISCGAALHHLRTGLAALGWLAVTDRLPDPDRPSRLATVELWPRRAGGADLALADAITRRHSDRRAYQPLSVDDLVVRELTRTASAFGVAVRPMNADAHHHLASAIIEADAHQRADPSYVYELARWTGRRTDLDDGVPSTATQLGFRQFDTSALRAAPATTPVAGMGTLLVLGTSDDDPLAQLRAGEATSAVLLAATGLGLASCPLTQPLEVPAIRAMLRTSVLDGLLNPQMVIRVGWPPTRPHPFPSSRRRPVADVLEHDDDEGAENLGE
jgi:nitroreductase